MCPPGWDVIYSIHRHAPNGSTLNYFLLPSHLKELQEYDSQGEFCKGVDFEGKSAVQAKRIDVNICGTSNVANIQISFAF